MHTGQFRVVHIHRGCFLAGVAQNWFRPYCADAFSPLQSCGGGSLDSSIPLTLKVIGTSLPSGTICAPRELIPDRKMALTRLRSDLGLQDRIVAKVSQSLCLKLPAGPAVRFGAAGAGKRLPMDV
jgi:hypothetical protein